MYIYKWSSIRPTHPPTYGHVARLGRRRPHAGGVEACARGACGRARAIAAAQRRVPPAQPTAAVRAPARAAAASWKASPPSHGAAEPARRAANGWRRAPPRARRPQARTRGARRARLLAGAPRGHVGEGARWAYATGAGGLGVGIVSWRAHILVQAAEKGGRARQGGAREAGPGARAGGRAAGRKEAAGAPSSRAAAARPRDHRARARCGACAGGGRSPAAARPEAHAAAEHPRPAARQGEWPRRHPCPDRGRAPPGPSSGVPPLRRPDADGRQRERGQTRASAAPAHRRRSTRCRCSCSRRGRACTSWGRCRGGSRRRPLVPGGRACSTLNRTTRCRSRPTLASTL